MTNCDPRDSHAGSSHASFAPVLIGNSVLPCLVPEKQHTQMQVRNKGAWPGDRGNEASIGIEDMTIGVLATCIATGMVGCLAYYLERCRRKIAEAALVDTKKALELQVTARAAERTGRIRAEVEQALQNSEIITLRQQSEHESSHPPCIVQKKLREQLATPARTAAPEAAYPLAPIGHLQSCFSQRNGTPRQPLLARNARAKLVLRYTSAHPH